MAAFRIHGFLLSLLQGAAELVLKKGLHPAEVRGHVLNFVNDVNGMIIG